MSDLKAEIAEQFGLEETWIIREVAAAEHDLGRRASARVLRELADALDSLPARIETFGRAARRAAYKMPHDEDACLRAALPALKDRT